MKSSVLLIIGLGCCAYAAGECVEINSDAKPSSPNVSIRVLFDGEPKVNVAVVVTLPKGQGSRVVKSDSGGMVDLKNLPAGTNCITAADDNFHQGNLCLAVSKQTGARSNSFALTMFSSLPPLPNVQGSEKSVAPERLRQLDLIISDPSGAVIPHAEILVFKRDSYRRGQPVLKAWTDQEGRFKTTLDPGTYVVAIRTVGFKSAVHLVEVTSGGIETQIREVLQVGGC